jgi:hypothetical protein
MTSVELILAGIIIAVLVLMTCVVNRQTKMILELRLDLDYERSLVGKLSGKVGELEKKLK